MSPTMYKEIIQSGHKLTKGYAHSNNLPVIVHSSAYVEYLENYGNILSLMGGIDVKVLYSYDTKKIDSGLRTES